MVGELKVIGSEYIQSLLTDKMKKRAARFEGTITRKRRLAKELLEVEISLEQDYEFLPGQYLWVEATDKQGKPFPGSKKAFSITDSASLTKKLHIIFRQTPKSGLYKNALTLKSKVVVSGARGSALLMSGKEKTPAVVIAAGTGIAPFLSHIRSINPSWTRPLQVFYFGRSEEDMPFVEELKMAAKKNKNLSFEAVVGEIGEANLRRCADKQTKNSVWYIIGPQGMVNLCAESLNQFGIKRENMIFENFYPQDLTQEQVFEDTFGSLLKPMNFTPKNSVQLPLLLQGIEQSNFHVIITDANGVVKYANPRASRLTGFSREEMLGSAPRLWGGLNEPEYYKLLWSNKLEGHTHDGEIINQRKNGELYVAMAHISPIFIQHKIVGFIATEEDITPLKITEEALKQSEGRFMLAVEGASVGLWDWNIKSGTEWWSERFYELLGYSPKELPASLENFQKILAPEDRERTMDLVQQHFQGKVAFRLEYRLKTKTLGYRWFLGSGQASFDENQQPTRMVGTITDIHEEVVARERLAKQNEELTKFNSLLVGRELKMVELKKSLEELKQKNLDADKKTSS